MLRPLLWWFPPVIACLCFCTACSRMPQQDPRTVPAPAPASPTTELARVVAAESPAPQLSGLRLLPTPPFAMHARLELARRARDSLDVQYYLIQDDETGRLFLRALRDAARRGVRVRLLIDDLHTAGADTLLEGLAAEPNVEVRLFNPFPAGRDHLATRMAYSLLDLKRLNRRMHNKLFIADGAMAILGGRNIADEYFLAERTSNFIDIDALVAGDVVPRLNHFFDTYWNSEYVYALSRVVPRTASPERLIERFDAQTRPASPAAALLASDLLGNRPLGVDFTAGHLALAWGAAEAYADAPGKALAPAAADALAPAEIPEGVRFNVRRLVRSAQREVVQTTPYLIPGAGGMESVRLLRARGVSYKLVTNSLAGTDESFVHSGYQHYRPALLAAGVELYELSPGRTAIARRDGRFASSGGRIHGKTVIVDEKAIYLGSLNFDPRSELYNTELGMIFFNAELAAQLKGLVELIVRETAYRVRAGQEGTEWVRPGDGIEVDVVQREEPETTIFTRILLRILGPLVPESML